MAEKAHVTSVEALDSFRAALITFVSKARPTVEEISSDVVRTRIWLEHDQRLVLEGDVRRRAKELEQAQASLSSAMMSNLRTESSGEQRAVRRAKAGLDDAMQKLKRLKQWNRDFDSRVGPLAKQLDKLHTVFSTELPGAAAYLGQAIQTLAAYAEKFPSAPQLPASTVAEKETEAEQAAKISDAKAATAGAEGSTGSAEPSESSSDGGGT